MTLVHVDTRLRPNEPAVVCHVCGCPDGLTLNADGRFVCRERCSMPRPKRRTRRSR